VGGKKIKPARRSVSRRSRRRNPSFTASGWAPKIGRRGEIIRGFNSLRSSIFSLGGGETKPPFQRRGKKKLFLSREKRINVRGKEKNDSE